MIRRGLLLLISCLFLLSLTGCVTYMMRYDSTFKGRVVDAETGKPVEGVVILGTWYKNIHTLVDGTKGRYYDAEETVTDKNGNFSLPGKGLRIMSNLSPGRILIFKAGYNYIGPSSWESFKTGEYLSKDIKWEGSRAIIPLKKLTMAERRESGTFPSYPPIEASNEKIKLFMEEIYKERKARGLK